MQINARTAQSLGYQGTASGLLDPETNLRYGVRYLAEAYRLADGDTCGTILRYQGGHRAQAMTAQAQGYCARVKTLVAKAN
jgi:soluble lytic murein transglycosylase-like protein